MNSISLRSQVLRGGAYLAARQGVGTAINVIGVLILTRTIGPHSYGVYAAAMGFFLALQLIAQMGVGVFLIRQERERDDEVYHAASTLLLGLGIAGAVAGCLTLPLIQQWTRIEGIGVVGLAIFATLPLSNLAQVPLARLDRALDYRRVAGVEVAAQLLFFAVALPLAFLGRGAAAPVAGWIAQQLLLVLLSHAAARYQPMLRWNRELVQEALRYGRGYTASLWVYQLRKVVNPLVVGRFLGAEAVGIVAVTTQIVTHLSFIAIATWRLSMAALARVQQSAERMNRAVSEGMLLQTVAVAPFLVVFAWLAPHVVPLLLGGAWADIVALYPFIAVSLLANAMFNLHSSALYVLRMNARMAAFHALHTGLLAVAAVALVPRLGLIGYGIAELVTVLSYVVLHGFTARAFGAPAYVRPLAIGCAAALGTAAGYIGIWSLAGIVAVTIALQPWRAISGILTDLRGMAYE